MGLQRSIGKRLDQVREQAKSSRNSMHPENSQANIASRNNMLSEDIRRQEKSVSKLDANALPNGPVSCPDPSAVSSSTGPQVPPHAAFSPMITSTDEPFLKQQPKISRKPTLPPKSEDLANGRPKLNSAISSGLPLSEELSGSIGLIREPQPHGPGDVEDSGLLLGQAVEEQSRQTQEQARDMKALRDSNYQHVAQIEILKDELQKEKDRHTQTTQAWRKAAAALSANRQEATYKVDDDTLRKDYQNIVYDVSAWVATYSVPKFDHVPESELRVFNTLTLHPHKYYHVKRTRELLLQSLLMHILVDLVFKGGLWWAGKQSAGLCVVQYALELGTYHDCPCILCVAWRTHLLNAKPLLTISRRTTCHSSFVEKQVPSDSGCEGLQRMES